MDERPEARRDARSATLRQLRRGIMLCRIVLAGCLLLFLLGALSGGQNAATAVSIVAGLAAAAGDTVLNKRLTQKQQLRPRDDLRRDTVEQHDQRFT